MKEFFKKLLEKIKTFAVGIWTKVKAWAIKTALPWLKKEWMQIVNILVIIIVYAKTDSLPGVQTITGLWLFVLLACYIFWKLLGVEHMFKKKVPIVIPITPPAPEVKNDTAPSIKLKPQPAKLKTSKKK
jgi:hypothetical protein